jgi:FlaA1/EpsC-like NDP-sugar epimerase
MLLLMLLDAFIVNVALALPLMLRFIENDEMIQRSMFSYIALAPWITITFIGIFCAFKLYNRAWAYASLSELFAIFYAVTIGSMCTIVIYHFAGALLPRSVILMQWALTILLLGASRVMWRCSIEYLKNGKQKTGRQTLIVGAGDAGVMVARELKNQNGGYLPVGFIDDNPNLKNIKVLGLPVLGSREKIPAVVSSSDIKMIVIAMPSAEPTMIRDIVDICRSTPAELKILPGMYQIINGQVSVNNMRPVQLEDLLRREPVRVNAGEIMGYLSGETVLITGAGGSIGSELLRQVATVDPKRLILMDHCENGVHGMWLELQDKFPDIPLAIEIADIRDNARVQQIFQRYRPTVVFHAAAHKHVPLMELHPAEAVKTNIFGTRNMAKAAKKFGTRVFIMISTDKAVNPSSVMGATKRIAELIVRQENTVGMTDFAAVRFGNVLGSSGSVVPLFEQQIARGGPVTVTHPDMKRYFMTIPEAVQLVIQAGAIAKGGEVFILDMGKPVKIEDLARDMIKLSGLEPDKDIKIKFTGIRPGEKLFEELLTAEEGSSATKHKRIFTARPALIEVSALERELAELSRKGLQCTAEDVFDALLALIPRFRSNRKEQVG